MVNMQPIIDSKDSAKIKKKKLIECICDYGATVYIQWEDDTISKIRYDEEQQKFFNGEYEFNLNESCEGVIYVTRETNSFRI